MRNKVDKTKLQQSGGFLPFLLPLAATNAPIAARALALLLALKFFSIKSKERE
jgi:hypothetical protein